MSNDVHDKPASVAKTDVGELTEAGHPLRHIRSFVRREGRKTIRQEAALEMLMPVWGREVAQGPVDLAQWFGRDAKTHELSTHETWLEIGFGMGASLVQQAQTHPQINFVGIEVHTPGIGAMLGAAQAAHCENIRVYGEDAIEVLKHCLADASFDRVQLFFPDPWHKKRHHKRRIVQNEFIQTIRHKLKIGGLFHMATDWQNYAEHMCDLMNVAEGFKNISVTNDYVPRPDTRPHTKFEARGERLGHGVWDLMYRRVS